MRDSELADRAVMVDGNTSVPMPDVISLPVWFQMLLSLAWWYWVNK